MSEKITVKKMTEVDAKSLIKIIKEMLNDTDTRINHLEQLKQKKIELLKSI